MAKVNKNAVIVTGIITTSIVVGTLIFFYDPSSPVPEPLEPEEVPVLFDLRNRYIASRSGSVTYTVNGNIEKFLNLFDSDVLVWVNTETDFTLVDDFVCVDKPPEGEKLCQRRKINYDPVTYKERMENLLRRGNPDF